MGGFLIWWTTQSDCEAIDRANAQSALPWPKYLRLEFSSRLGRNGRGRLWCSPALRNAPDGTNGWPNTPLAERLASDYGGIVIRASDRLHLDEMPGVITDFNLRRA